ncbi:MAG: nucleotidyl transferase AbiEii/AbiGii toxin family protein, partial [Acidimicrobiia bacterium]
MLTETQQRFLEAFFDGDSRNPFYLSGGTALAAYYLHHRFSDDLDFFTRERHALSLTLPMVDRATRAAGLEIARSVPRGDLVQYFFTGDRHPEHPLVKAEFVFDTPPYFAPPRLFDGVIVDDLLS